MARAHHGSLAREERSKVEELLKAGELPVPGCHQLARARHRHGRCGPRPSDRVAQVGRARAAAHRARRAQRGRGEPRTDLPQVPRRSARVRGRLPADARRADRVHRRAPQRSRRARSADRRHRRGGRAGESRASRRRRLGGRAARARDQRYPYSELSRELLENVLDMLDGRYPSKEFGELRARIVWDRVEGTIRARSGSRQLAVANAGTIPDRGLYAVTLPDGRRVGELDEEMVYEARPGQAFLLGASTWRIEEIGRDRVIVTPAPGAPGAVPFWKGDSVGRGKELGEAVGAFARWAVEQDAGTLERDYDLDERAARNLLSYLQRAAGGHPRAAERPHARARALSRRDRRLAPVPALALRRPRSRGLGPGPVGAHPRAFRPRGRRDLERRRDRSAPPRPGCGRSRGASLRRRARPARARGGRAGAHRRARRLGPVRGPLSRERLACSAHPSRLPGTAHAPVAAAAEGPEPARGGEPLRRLPDRARDLPGVPVRRARRLGP